MTAGNINSNISADYEGYHINIVIYMLIIYNILIYCNIYDSFETNNLLYYQLIYKINYIVMYKL